MNDNHTNISIRESIDLGANIVFKRPLQFIFMVIIYSIITVGLNSIVFFGQIVGFVVLPILSLGFMIASHEVYQERPLNVSMLFKGFSGSLSDRLMISFVFMIVNIALLSAYFGITYFIIEGKIDDSSDFFSSWTGSMVRIMYLNVLFGLAIAYTQVIFMFSLMQTYFRSLSAGKAMNAAMAMVKGQMWKLLLLTLVLLLINALGAMLFFAGLIVTIPMSFAALYIAFLRSVNLELDTAQE